MTNKHSAEHVADQAKGDLEKQLKEDHEKGYRGWTPDPNPNEAYTLATGPESPTAVPDDRTRVDQHHHQEG